MGYYSPKLQLSRKNKYVETVMYEGIQCLVWEEEFAKYYFLEDLDEKVYKRSDGTTVFYEEVIRYIGKIGDKHIKGFPGKSGWVRFETFGADETEDEIMECVHTFDKIVKNKIPQYLERWQNILQLFEENSMQLRQIYNQLSTSTFQGDFWEQNLLIDENGHFKGNIDYNLAGEDVVINIFLTLRVMGIAYPSKEKRKDPDQFYEWIQAVILHMLDTLQKLREQYHFSELEIQAMPLLYKYVSSIEYGQIELLEANINNETNITKIFDYIERELRREDIDFRSSMVESNL